MVDKEPKGFITVGIEPLSLAGNYLAKFLIAYPAGFVPPVKPDSPKLVLRLELGRGCERVVTKDELVAGQFREFQLRCEHKVNGPQRVRIYWFGNLPALVGPIQLSSE